jgi:hypothetical protein
MTSVRRWIACGNAAHHPGISLVVQGRDGLGRQGQVALAARAGSAAALRPHFLTEPHVVRGWVEVAPDGADTVIALAPPGPGDTAGARQTGISLQTNDIDTYHAQLKAADVDVDTEISRMGGAVPPMFWLRDHEANVLLVVEVR